MTVVRIGGDEAPRVPQEGPAEPEAAPGSGPGSHLVVVTWRDAWFEFDESDPEDGRSDYLVTTVGFVVRQGPDFVSIAQEILPDGDGFRAITHIPVSVVRSIEPLQLPEPEQERHLAAP